jgi:catechol 2,3-dioxygenase-like lactoylglutathione lyase family enzyme
MIRKDTSRLLEPRSIFKATAINHLSYSVIDYARTRDWFMDLFGMKCVFDDGKQCSVSFGNPPREIYIRKKDKAPVMLHWAFSIAGFEAKTVEATLHRLGLSPRWDGDYAFHTDDPDGFLTQICAETGVFPGAGVQGAIRDGKVPTGDRASRPGVWKATAFNHISYGVPNYARTRDYYMDLFGMRLVFEDGIKASVAFGGPPEDAIYIVERDDGPVIDHIAVSVADFDLDKVEADIKRLGLTYAPDGDSAWSIRDPDGYTVQVCAATGVYPGAAFDFFHQTRKK